VLFALCVEVTQRHQPEIDLNVAELIDFIGDDAADIIESSDPAGAVEAAARLLLTVRAKAAGEVPHGWTEAAVCALCGPVWLWPEVDRTSAALACPWCENRAAGFTADDDGRLIEARPIPRPEKVRCGDCRHWTADVIGDGGGIGTCSHGGPMWTDRPAFRNVRRWCSVFAQTSQERNAKE
jgi:hypothetical protein